MDSEFLNVEYEYTIDDAVNTNLLLLARSDEATAIKRRDRLTFVGALVVAGIIVTVLIIKMSGGIAAVEPISALVSLGFVAIACLSAFGFHGQAYDRMVRRRTRRMMLEQLGGAGPHSAVCEIRPDVLRVDQRSLSLELPWDRVQSVEDDPDNIWVWFEGAVVRIPVDAFESDGRRSEFVGALAEKVAEFGEA